MQTKDLVIIGGGPAGYVAAIRASQLGAKVTLIEQSGLGGTCVSRGCIPVKALLRAAELIDLGKSARDYGVNFPEPTIDFAKMMARKDTVVKTVSSGVKLLLEGNRVELVNGFARFQSPLELEVKLAGGGSTSIKANRIIVATGARPFVPAGLRDLGSRVITTDGALSLSSIPGSVLILGGGFIGLALATIFSRLGSKVTVLQESERLLAGLDPEIVTVLEKELKKNKVRILVRGQNIVAANGNVSASTSDGQVELDSDVVIAAEHRQANIDGLSLDKAGIVLNDKGGIKVTSKMETSAAGVFAAGDVTVERMFTHVAYASGIVAAENAMGKESRIDYSVVPLASNTIPELACFGLTEEQAKEEGYSVKVVRFPMAANAAATVLGQRTGLIKLVSDEKYGQILGCHIVGPQASSLIAEVALAAKMEATPSDIASLMHTHPTLPEVAWEAARSTLGQPIHVLPESS